MTHYAAIDQILDWMPGANASVSGSATTGTTGSVSAGVKPSTDVKVDASTRTSLIRFRKHLDAFHATAMTATSSQGSADLDIPELPGVTASGAIVTGPTSQTRGATRAPGAMVNRHPPRSSATGATGATSTSTQVVGTTGISPERTASMNASRAAASATIARLTAAIDDMLRANASPGAGNVCVDHAALEQLRRDIEALDAVR